MNDLDNKQLEPTEKPVAIVVGENGNVFNLMAIVSRALKEAGRPEQASEMYQRVTGEAEDYDQALRIMMEYADLR